MALKVSLLENKNWDNKVIPSSSIYFRKYPYRITFERSLRNMEEWVDMHMEISMFTDDTFKGTHRRYFGDYKQRLYLSSYEDLIQTYGWYGDQISEVNGPVSEAHCDILSDPNQSYMHKPNGYYRQYNAKFEAVPKWGVPFKDRKDMMQEVKKSLKEFSGNIKILHENYERWYTTFYMDYNEWKDIHAFVKLSFPDLRIWITRTEFSS